MSKSVADIIKEFDDEFGDNIARYGSEIPDIESFSSGVFPLDVALGGGLPKGKITIIYGPEDSGKSLLGYLVIADYQKKCPKEVCVVMDIEHNFDKVWAVSIGIDPKRLVVIRPDHGEQAVDMVDGLMSTDNLGILLVDSLAALTPINELKTSASNRSVGGNSLLIGEMMRGLVCSLSRNERGGRFPSVICINQIRIKVGFVMGNPEYQPGGKAIVFAACAILGVRGKHVTDPKIIKDIPIKMSWDITLKKVKFPICQKKIEELEVVIKAHKGYPVGYVSEWKHMVKYLQKGGVLKKSPKGSGYHCFDEFFKTQGAIFDKMHKDKKYAKKIKERVFEIAFELLEVQE